METLEYELNKSMKGRGSAVAAVLGLRTEDTSTSIWVEDSTKSRPFDQTTQKRPSSPGFMPSNGNGPSGMTGAQPLETQDGEVRVRSKRVSTRDAVAPTVPFDEHKKTNSKKAQKQAKSGGGGKGWLAVLAILVLAGGGYGAYHFMSKGTLPQKPDTPPTPVANTASPETPTFPPDPINTPRAPGGARHVPLASSIRPISR